MNKRLSSWLTGAVWIIGIFAFRSSFADQYFIPSGSMEPTIQIGDHVLVDKAAYDLRIPFTQISLREVAEPKRGDIIVFRDPRDPSVNLIKRLVGIPGDRVHVIDGVAEINGSPESPHRVQRIPRLARHEDRVFVVPPGEYFFLGDNRDNSADSRVWGFAPRNFIYGRAERVLYSVRWESWLPDVGFERTGTRL